MFVPLPPFLTYRASYLIEDSLDSAYWHAVFEAEWVTLVIYRWCADILQGIFLLRQSRTANPIEKRAPAMTRTTKSNSNPIQTQWEISHRL
jgi:hypothetical protein